MKKELEDMLYAKYPKIFGERKLDERQTCMCWGCECSDGWYDIISELCETLQFNTDRNGYPQVVFQQVKEKYGSLTIYHYTIDKVQKANFLEKIIVRTCRLMNWVTDKLWSWKLIDSEYSRIHIGFAEHRSGVQDGLIDFSERISTLICEDCGERGKMSHRGSWMRTQCITHREKENYNACDEDTEWLKARWLAEDIRTPEDNAK